MRTNRKKVGIVAVTALLLGLAACGDDGDSGGDGAGDGGGGGVEVTAVDFAFEPSEVTAEPGEAITLRNEDDVEHSFTIDDAEVDGHADGGEEVEVMAPDESGTYDFYCVYHPEQMTGTLTVE